MKESRDDTRTPAHTRRLIKACERTPAQTFNTLAYTPIQHIHACTRTRSHSTHTRTFNARSTHTHIQRKHTHTNSTHRHTHSTHTHAHTFSTQTHIQHTHSHTQTHSDSKHTHSHRFSSPHSKLKRYDTDAVRLRDPDKLSPALGGRGPAFGN